MRQEFGMARLWDKGGDLDALIHRFTVGDDPHWDRRLAYFDCLGSAAHARTLHRAKLLTDVELAGLLRELNALGQLAAEKKLEIPPELEDCHTTIEAALTQRLGDGGKKIHAGRSRNDQVATAMRLWMRAATHELLKMLADFARTAAERIERDGQTPMPGYTHLQPAMPSSVGQFLHAVLEAVVEQQAAGLALLDRLDACPLGTGAGFGVQLPLDRGYTAQLLGFSRVQRSPIDVQNARGRLERYVLRFAIELGSVLEKLACDLLMFSTPAYGFFTLPPAFTTGSSIMPQKCNPDVLELLRARAARLRAREQELAWVTAKLPSSYHRDLQLTKEPVIRGVEELGDMLGVATRVLAEFGVNRERLAQAMTPELYAADAAYALVRQGTPFRDAYKQIAAQLASGKFAFDRNDPALRSAGLADAAAVSEAMAESRTLAEQAARRAEQVAAAIGKLFKAAS